MTTRTPRPATPYFGHEAALQRVGQWVATEPVVTITGIGGAGKTRFAIALAEHVQAELGLDPTWVTLAQLDDPAGIVDAVAAVAGTRPKGGETVIDSLSRHYTRQPGVLLLDNCEHLLVACADLVAELTARCPDLHVIATSREALDVPGERVWRLETLPLPDNEESAARDIPAAVNTAGIALFIDRAQRQRPEFTVDGTNIRTVTRLCRRLEGVPLALELAAAQLSSLSLDDIDQRLARGIDALKRHGDAGPERHATMQASLEGSVSTLAAAECRLFELLSVFRGTFSLAACLALFPEDPERPVTEQLTTLVDKSLVAADVLGGSTRYRLLEPLRLYAAKRLPGVDASAAARNHAIFFTRLADEASNRLKGEDRPAALAELDREHGNLLTAWRHAIRTEDHEAIATLAQGLFWHWNFSNRFDEGRRLCEQALAAADGAFAGIAALQHAAGTLAWMQGDYAVAHERLENAIELARRSGDEAVEGMALRELAGVRMTEEDFHSALSHIEQSLARLTGDAMAWDAALCLVLGGDTREAAGDADGAREMRLEARERFRHLADPWGEALAAFGLAMASARSDEYEPALRELHDALAIQKASGDDWNVAQCELLLADIEARRGQADAARPHCLEAMNRLRMVGDRAVCRYALALLATLEEQRGHHTTAAKLLGATRSRWVPAQGQYPYALADLPGDLESRLLESMGASEFAQAHAEGKALDMDAAIAMALASASDASPGTGKAGTASEEPSPLSLKTLGASDVWRQGRKLETSDWAYALPRELLFYLLVNGPCSKDRIGLDLWPEASAEQLRGRFRSTLYQLRQALGDPGWIRFRDGQYAFDPDDRATVDLRMFEQAAALGLQAGQPDPLSHLEAAVACYQGEFLAGEAVGDWAEAHRERLGALYRKVAVALGQTYLAGGDGKAAGVFQRLVDADPCDEAASRGLATAFWRAGDRSRALRCLDRLADQLEKELDVEPEAATRELRRRIADD